MCGCVEQMPTVSRSDCTQVDLAETFTINYDPKAKTFDYKLTYVKITFNACKGINNRNNDLWAYIARLHKEDEITKEQFSQAGRIITDKGCPESIQQHLNDNLGLSRGYDHDVTTWTKVAGRDDLSDGHPFGLAAFNTAFFENSLTGDKPIMMRICATCTGTHQKIFYRRLNAVTGTFNLLNNILYHRNNGGGQNKWTEDFTLHSTYEDAVAGANPWKCPGNSFNVNAPFYGDCSPTGARVRYQESIFNWDSTRRDVAYFVNTPEGTGVEELDLDATATTGFEGFTDVDLGSPGFEGKTFIMEPKSERRALVEGEGGPIILTGSGHDIWGYNDAGHFLSQPWSGDVDVIVHVSAFNDVYETYAKTGIMLRADNSHDATFVMGALSGTKGAIMFARKAKAKHATHGGNNYYVTNPVQKSSWIRLTKIGEGVQCFFKNNEDEEWKLKGTVSIRFPEDTYRVGLAVTSRHNSYVSEAVFEDWSVDKPSFPTISPTVSSAPTVWHPLVEIGGAREGSKTYVSPGKYRYRAYGTGIWGTSDSFFYDNRMRGLGGAFDVITYISYFNTAYGRAKGGIMIRDTNDPDSAHAFIGVRGHFVGVTFQTRATAGAITEHHQTNFVPNHNTWVKLSKPADSGTITAYYRILDTDEWMELGSADITFTGQSVQVGVAATAGSESASIYLDTVGYEVIDQNSSTENP